MAEQIPTEPVRTCVGCRRRAGQSALVRFVVSDRRLVLGAGRAGRGAWLCRDRLLECFDAARERRRWNAVLRTDIAVAELSSLRTELLEELS